MASYLFSPITPLSDRYEVSHRVGWGLYLAEELGARLITTSDMPTFNTLVKSTDKVFVYHGMEFRDSLNFPGGPPPVAVARAKDLQEIAGRLGPNIISMDIPMPDYGRLLGSRGLCNEAEMRKAMSRAGWHPWPNDFPDEMIVGDSHALSLYRRGARVFRHDALTLYGALRIGLTKLVDDAMPEMMTVKSLMFYFGNIDIRHHVLRRPRQNMVDLIAEYVRQVMAVQRKYKKLKIFVADPLPIETVDRRLPKTGWFKGTPYFGSWEDRKEVRDDWVAGQAAALRAAKIGRYEHPPDFWNGLGELSENVMEKPGSVHIRPGRYRHINEGNKWTCIG